MKQAAILGLVVFLFACSDRPDLTNTALITAYEDPVVVDIDGPEAIRAVIATELIQEICDEGFRAESCQSSDQHQQLNGATDEYLPVEIWVYIDSPDVIVQCQTSAAVPDRDLLRECHRRVVAKLSKRP